MKHFTATLLIIFFAGASLAEVDLTQLPPASTQTGVTFEKDISPLFQDSCIRCHGAEKPKAGLRLDSLAAVLKGRKHGKFINPGHRTKSGLVIAISRIDPETTMPPIKKPRAGKDGSAPPPKPLTPEQVGLVRAWIDQGAN